MRYVARKETEKLIKMVRNNPSQEKADLLLFNHHQKITTKRTENDIQATFWAQSTTKVTKRDKPQYVYVQNETQLTTY